MRAWSGTRRFFVGVRRAVWPRGWVEASAGWLEREVGVVAPTGPGAGNPR